MRMSDGRDRLSWSYRRPHEDGAAWTTNKLIRPINHSLVLICVTNSPSIRDALFLSRYPLLHPLRSAAAGYVIDLQTEIRILHRHMHVMSVAV